MPLRVVAIGSNVLFATYGALAHIHPVFLLHVVLLPINITRLIQAMYLSKDIGAINFFDLLTSSDRSNVDVNRLSGSSNVVPSIFEFGKRITHPADVRHTHCTATFLLRYGEDDGKGHHHPSSKAVVPHW
jgi:hypothetical protein